MRSFSLSAPWRRTRSTSAALAAGTVLALVLTSAALGADGNLPGGTAITVSIDDPAQDLNIVVDDDDDTVNLTLEGTASLAGTAAAKNTTLLYILDLSGSMSSTAGVDCNGNGSNDSRLVCQRESIAFINALAAQPASPVGLTGLGTYDTDGKTYNLDLDPGRSGDRFLVAPDYDGNGNGIPDLVDVVNGEGQRGLTNFSAGLDQALLLLAESPNPVNRVVYISDGEPNRGTNVNGYAGEFDGFGTTRIDTFAITSGSGCNRGGANYGNLTDIATLGSVAGTCTEVLDLNDLNFVLGQVLNSELTDLTGSINGGDPQPLTTMDVDLPADGPIDVAFTWDVGELGVGTHEFCVTAAGLDGGGSGSISDCRTITITVAEDPAEEPTEEPSEEPAEEPAEEPSEEPTEEPAEEVDPDDPELSTVLPQVLERNEDEGDRDIEVISEAQAAEAVEAEPDFTG